MEYTKISDTEMEVVETVTRKAVLSLDGLRAERDGLVRTKDANTAECTARNNQIDAMIARLDEIISEGEKKGLKTKAEVEPMAETPVVEEVVAETIA